LKRAVRLNQQVDGQIQAAGEVEDWQQLAAWLSSLSRRKYPHLTAFIHFGVAESLKELETELLDAFVSNALAGKYPWQAEALLLTVVGRDRNATALGLGENLPLAPGLPNGTYKPVTILDRAVRVTMRTWTEWSVKRQQREYLLLELYDAFLGEKDADSHCERVTVCLQLLAGE